MCIARSLANAVRIRWSAVARVQTYPLILCTHAQQHGHHIPASVEMMRLSLLSAVVVAAARAALRSDASAGGAGGAGLTLVPGAQSGMLIDIQFLNPHAYGPNEPFSQEWVYEGLVSYAEGGVLRPALATGWSVSSPSPAPSPADGRVNITFALRQGVTFHDGAPWNAEACKINFDNVFSPALTAGYHSWYQLPASVVR